MKTEISAGGIIVRKKEKVWEVLLIRDMNGNWTFPKGLVEPHESHEETAKREIAEEVGAKNIELLHELTPIEYMYQRNGLIKKTVYYFLFESLGDEDLKGQKEEGISEVKWAPIDEILNIVGYKQTNLPLLQKSMEFLHLKS